MKILRRLGVVVAIVCVVGTVRACAPKSELDAAKNQLVQLQAENSRLKADLKVKAALPVQITFRRAFAAPGYVAVINTTVKSPLSVLLTHKSAALGTVKRFELHLDPDNPTELGGLDGAVFEVGDDVTLENQNYSAAKVRLAAP